MGKITSKVTAKSENILEEVINPATETKQNDIISAIQDNTLTIDNAIDSVAYDLNASAFSEATVVSNDYIFDSVEFNFSTAESKTITITSLDGTILYSDTNTEQNICLSFDKGFNGGENLTVVVTQFSNPGTMDCILKIKQGGSNLSGNPVLGAGTETIGKVGINNDSDVQINPATEEKQDALITELKLKADLTETQPVSATTLPLPTGASTSTKQLPDNHQVTVSNPTSNPETGLATSAKQDTMVTELQKMIGFEIGEYDYIALTYVASGDAAGEIETVIYKTGGSGGVTVATLTLGYTVANLTSVTRT